MTNPRLRSYVQDRLEGKVRDAEGHDISGPLPAPFIGRNKPHRGDRKWGTCQIFCVAGVMK
jgi:hypothetical protein